MATVVLKGRASRGTTITALHTAGNWRALGRPVAGAALVRRYSDGAQAGLEILDLATGLYHPYITHDPTGVLYKDQIQRRATTRGLEAVHASALRHRNEHTLLIMDVLNRESGLILASDDDVTEPIEALLGLMETWPGPLLIVLPDNDRQRNYAMRMDIIEGNRRFHSAQTFWTSTTSTRAIAHLCTAALTTPLVASYIEPGHEGPWPAGTQAPFSSQVVGVARAGL